MKRIALPLLLAVTALCLCVAADEPDFCMGWECPEYDVVRSSDAFEIRRYPQTRWMSVRFQFAKTDSMKEAFLHAMTEGNKILTDYRGGQNIDKIELNLTYPLRVTLTTTTSSRAESDDTFTFVTSYFLPSLAQQHPPQPIDHRIFQEDLPELTVAVAVYKHGAPSWDRADAQWQKLRAALRAEGVSFCESSMDVLSYDYRAKHTEVVVLVTSNQPASSLSSPAAVDAEGEPIATGTNNNNNNNNNNNLNDQAENAADDAVAEPNDHPDFCGDRDCPGFEVKRSTRTFEIREYSKANWAVLNVTVKAQDLDAAYSKALTTAFPIIYNYRQKGNEEQVELAHTLPMTVVWQKCDQNDENGNAKCFDFFFAYFIPFQFQDKVPTPNDKRLEISSWGPLSLAVRSFGGFVKSLSNEVTKELEKLKQDLDSHEEKYDEVVNALAQYDPIWKISDRHNEVHLLIKDQVAARPPFLRSLRDTSSSPSSSSSSSPSAAAPDGLADAVAEPNDHPNFCGDRDCPGFEVKRSTRTFEIREYSKANWAVVTHKESGSLDAAYLKALKTVIPLIVGYRNKGNKEEVQLAHTLPMLVGISDQEKDEDERNQDKDNAEDKKHNHKFLFAYFIPFEYQDKVPSPNDKRVKIVSVESVSLAVRSFSGFVSSLSKVAKRELAKLQEDLKSHEEDYHKHKFLVAQYDPIFKIAHRHNEVAVLIKTKDKQGHSVASLPFFTAFADGVAQEEEEQPEQQPEQQSESSNEEQVVEESQDQQQPQQQQQQAASQDDEAAAAANDDDEESVFPPDDSDDNHMPPAFCHELDCPDFDKIRSGRHFSVRTYKATNWLSFNQTSHSAFVQDADFKAIMQSAMNIIMEYNSGHNKEGVKVPVTVPVRVMLRERYGPEKDKTLYTVSFFVPIKYQHHTPQPLDERLTVGELEEYTVASRGFKQCSLEWDSTLMAQVDELAVDLSKAGEEYKRDHTIISFYDYPQLPVCATRHPYSEIWFPVSKDE